MMCSAYRLNKQGDSRQPCHPPFSILNLSVVSCRVLTIASWPSYRFLRKQVSWSGIPISLRAFHSLLWSTQSKALSMVNEKEIAVFLKFPCFFYNLVSVCNLVLLPFLNPAWASGSSWFTYCWSLACKTLSMTLLAWEMSVTVWWLAPSLVLPFLGIGMRIDLFQSCGH